VARGERSGTMPKAATDTYAGVHGPLDFLILEFPADRLTGAVVPELVALVEKGLIRVYDLLIVMKGSTGDVQALKVEDSPFGQELHYFAGASSGLLADDDVRQAANAMEPGTVAALLLYENAWAIPFVAAARSSGGELIAGGRVPATVVMDALEALENNDLAST
jgi:hypothetical protein